MSRYSRRPLAGFAALAPCAALMASVASVALVALVALSACSSPPSRFYTLAGGLASSEVRSAAPPLLMIDVAAVDVPAQVARSALVVQTSATRVDVLEQARWASLPADEIRLALSQELAQRLDAIDVSRSPRPAGVSVYRVKLSVQRFESWPGSHALIDAVWSVRALSEEAVLTCRSVVSEPVGAGNDALVAGHRQALQQIAANVADGIRALDAAARAHRLVRGQAAPPCPAQ